MTKATKKPQAKAATQPIPAPTIDPPRVAHKLLLDLSRHDCHYPVSQDDQGRHLFCAEPVAKRNYCREHFAISYRAHVRPPPKTAPRLRVSRFAMQRLEIA